MNPILILYATREGHTHRIADHIAELLCAHGLPVEERDARNIKEPFDCSGYAAAILAASVHLQHHEREMVLFVKRHRDALSRLPSAFLSVSLSEAGAERDAASPEQRAQSAADVDRMLSAFFHETGWHPDRVSPVAGALRYTKYGLLLRWIMKRKARRAGASTDTSRDHALTDWEGLDRFITAFMHLLPHPEDGPAAALGEPAAHPDSAAPEGDAPEGDAPKGEGSERAGRPA